MSSRGGGAGWLWFILIMVVIGVVVELVKMIMAMIGMALMATTLIAVIAMAIFGLDRFIKDVNSGRFLVSKCIIPLCIIGVVVLLCGPKLMGLFQRDVGILWWHKTETNYMKLLIFMLFSTPVAFGFGYALAHLFSSRENRESVKLIVNGDN